MTIARQTRNIEQYALVHQRDRNYGRSSERKLAQLVLDGRQLNPSVILDYGCGKSAVADHLAERLGARAVKYDPAIPELAELKVSAADLVVNTDVLEHLDEGEIATVLTEIAGLSQQAYINVSIRPAVKLLPNGENAHATVKPSEWWHDLLLEHFDIATRIPSQKDEATFVTWLPDTSTRFRSWMRYLVGKI